MNSHTSLVAQQTRLSEWAEMIRNCQNRPQGMTIDEWCQLHDITKANYYWRLLKVFREFLYIPSCKTFQIVDNNHKYLNFGILFSGIYDCYPLSN